MKSTRFALRTAVLIVIGSITTGCSISEKKQDAEHSAHHKHAEGGHSGGHMGHMNDVKQRLKFALGDKYNHPVPPATEEQLRLGKIIFFKSCAVCHGENGKGNGQAAAGFKQKPADFTDSEHTKYYSDQGRIYIIKKGIEGTPMPAWETVLNEREIQSVYAYVLSLRNLENGIKHDHSDHSH